MELEEMVSLCDNRSSEHNKTGFLHKADWDVLCWVIKKYNCKNDSYSNTNNGKFCL